MSSQHAGKVRVFMVLRWFSDLHQGFTRAFASLPGLTFWSFASHLKIWVLDGLGLGLIEVSWLDPRHTLIIPSEIKGAQNQRHRVGVKIINPSKRIVEQEYI